MFRVSCIQLKSKYEQSCHIGQKKYGKNMGDYGIWEKNMGELWEFGKKYGRIMGVA